MNNYRHPHSILSFGFMNVEVPDGAGDTVRNIAIAGATVVGLAAIKSVFTQVPNRHIGLRTRNGKVFDSKENPYGSVGPGLRRRMPLVSGISLIDLRERTTPLNEVTLQLTKMQETKDVTQQAVKMSAVWHILDKEDEDGLHFAYRQYLKLANGEAGLETTVSSIVSEAVVSVAPTLTVDEFSSKESLFTLVDEEARPHLRTYGVGLVALRLTQIVNSPAQTLGSLIADGLSRSGELSLLDFPTELEHRAM